MTSDPNQTWHRPGWVHALGPAALTVVVVFTLGSVRAETLPTPEFNLSDKVGHFVVFGLVQVVHARAVAFLAQESRPSFRSLSLAMLSSTVLGGFLEIWQAYLPYRSAEWGDLLADGLGAVLGGLVFAAFSRPQK